MNKKLNLTIATISVEVKVVRIDGKQMTKSVFNQVEKEESSPIAARNISEQQAFGTDVDVILGYINDGLDKWLLYTNKKGSLRRALLEHWGYGMYIILEEHMRDEQHLFIAV